MIKLSMIRAFVRMFSIMWISYPLEKVIVDVNFDELTEVVVV